MSFNVLMLTHKSRSWLPQVLPRLIHPNVQNLIVVDSGADNSANIIQQYFPEAIILTDKSNNLAYLRNLALRESEKHPCTYTAFIDSDMIMPVDFFDRTAEFLDTDSTRGAICIGGILQFNGTTYTAKFWRNYVTPPHSIVEQQYVCTGSTTFKTEAIKNIEIDERCRRSDEDVDLCCQIGQRGYKIYCDYNPPLTVHIRDATVQAEVSRFWQFGKHRHITLLKYGPNKMILKTVCTDILTYASLAGLVLTPFFGLVWLLPTAIIFCRHLLKVKRKRRIDHVIYSMLLSYVYNSLTGLYLVKHLVNFRRRHRKRENRYSKLV